MTAPILKLIGVNKLFGSVDVLHDINLKVRAGEVLCLPRDTGAAKRAPVCVNLRTHPVRVGSGRVLVGLA